MAHYLPQTVNDIPTSRHHPESSNSPARFTGPRGIGFHSKKNFKAVLKAASFSLHQDDYDIHSGVGPEPRYILGPHPESKRIIFRDMNFEIYNPKVGYTNSSGRKARLFEKLYEKHRKQHKRDRNKEEVSPDSKLFGNMLERTPLHNLKFTDRLAMELEAEGKPPRENNDSPQKDSSPFATNPLRAMRGFEPPKYLMVNKENSTLEKSPVAQGSAEINLLPLVRKRTTNQSPNRLKLEPIQQRALTRRRPSEEPSFETFARFNKRNHSMDVPSSESKLALNVSKVSFVESGEHQLSHESSKKSIPQDNKSTLTERSPKKAQKEFRQVISKTLFKRPSDGSAQGSYMIQRLFYGGIMQKTAAE